MKFGIFILGEKPPMLPGDEVYRRNLDQCRAADDMGYDTIWLGEHHFSPYGTIADPFVFGASVAAVTKHARIGTAVVIPAFMNPIRMAERVAMVDAISGGRFDLGLGRGYQQKEFKKFGIPMEESTERFIEAVEVIENLLTRKLFVGRKVHPRRGHQHFPAANAAEGAVLHRGSAHGINHRLGGIEGLRHDGRQPLHS